MKQKNHSKEQSRGPPLHAKQLNWSHDNLGITKVCRSTAGPNHLFQSYKYEN